MQKNPAKTVLLFALKAAALYALFVVQWSGVTDGYRWLFRQAGNAMFYRVGDASVVRFEKIDGGAEGKDTRVMLQNRRSGQAGALEIRSLYFGYRPAVFMTALILATPIPWRRRGRALAWGLICVTLFVGLRLWLRVTDAFCDPNMLGLYEISALWRSLLHGVMLVVSLAPATTYFAPLIIWGLVTFRREDWSSLMEGRVSEPIDRADNADNRSRRSRHRTSP